MVGGEGGRRQGMKYCQCLSLCHHRFLVNCDGNLQANYIHFFIHCFRWYTTDSGLMMLQASDGQSILHKGQNITLSLG